MLTKLKNKFINLIVILINHQFVPWRLRTTAYKTFGLRISPDSTIGFKCIIAGTLNNIVIGNHVYINHSCFIGAEAKITIEDYVRIGPFVRIMTRMHPIEASIVRRKRGSDVDITKTIGYGSWIGLGSTILPGVDIAEGCVIGAGSVVTKSTAPNGLYVGCPAKRIRDLPI